MCVCMYVCVWGGEGGSSMAAENQGHTYRLQSD